MSRYELFVLKMLITKKKTKLQYRRCDTNPQIYAQGPADLKVTELPDPKPKPNEYLIQVHSAAANFFDILQVQGKYQNQPRMFLLFTNFAQP
jgi:hypothetical protein